MPRTIAALALVLGLVGLAPATAFAQEIVPDRRIVVTRDMDFPGGDLQPLFDTTLTACRTACLADRDCAAFTFNTRSNACFPKSAVQGRSPYAGALSAEVVATAPGALQSAAARIADLDWLGRPTLEDARDLALEIGTLHPAGGFDPDTILQAALERANAGDRSGAAGWMGAAVSLLDRSDLWVEYARLTGQIQTQDYDSQIRLRERAVSAAVNGYLRADAPAQRVSALEVLAQALEAAERGRDMIPSLRLAQSIAPRADLDRALEEAVAKYGFRVIGNAVESDSAAPRICAQFSEPLIKAGQDYTPFVNLLDATLSVEAQDNQLCVDGVRHGERYRIVLRAGLPAASGETLLRDVEQVLYVRDRSPSIVFPGRAYVLPRSADAAVPVQTVNLDRIDLTLRRVSDRNLIRAMQEDYFGSTLPEWQERGFASEIATEVWTGTGETGRALNRDMVTRLPLGDVLADQPAGIYALTARVPGADPYADPGATQWFVLSDLGLSTMLGTDGLHVTVRHLSDASAVEGARVEVLSRANAVIADGATDAQGYLRIDPGLTRGTGTAAPAMVVVRHGSGSGAGVEDIAFLSLTDPAFDLSDRGVEGRPPSPPIDVFLATDRGAYRAGEVIHATVLARDDRAAAIPGLPVTAILTRPDGVEYSRSLSTEDVAGGHVFALPLGDAVPRGTWRLEVKADVDAAPLASRTVLVEDFLPERIDFDLSLPDGALRAGDTPPLRVEARYLFGAPGAGLAVEGEVLLRGTDTVEGFPLYRFGRHDEPVSPRSRSLEATRTDEAGRVTLPLTLPDVQAAGSPLEARVTLRVSEGSNRPVERELTRALTPDTPMIGIRPLFDGALPEGAEAIFRIIGLSPDLTPAPLPVRWSVNRVETRYQWYQQFGEWQWEPITTRTRIDQGEAVLGTEPLEIATPVDWGQYELVVETREGVYAASSTGFDAGWYAPADTATTPDLLELSLDKPAYRSGETAMLRIVPRHAGIASVAVMSNRLISMQTVAVAEGETLIPLTVTDDWGAGAYVTATVIRPMDAAAGRMPTRALGLAHAGVDPGARQLSVSIDAPEAADPRGPLEVAVQVDGITQDEMAHVTLAAVDLGILNLTGFDSPDPSAHYFGQRRLGMELRDVYGRLIDSLNGAMGQVRSGGDAGAGMRLQSPPPTEDLLAFFSGPVTVGADGRAVIGFDLPAFNGTVRLMAVAWSPSAVGQAEADVLVRDPVVVSASLPRFMAPGDESRLLLEVTHASGPVGRMGLDVTADGVTLAPVPSGVTLAEGEKQVVVIPVTADQPGDHVIRVALTTPEGRQLVKSLTLPVRANDPEVAVTERVVLAPDEGLDLSPERFNGLRAGTGSLTLAAGPLARLNAPALLAMLDRYPYGCTEQVASQTMPLLAMQDMVSALDLGDAEAIRIRIDQSLDRILTRQSGNGSFGLWQAGSGDFWLDAYVTDLLSRARAAGHDVPELAFRLALDNLRNRINFAPDFDEGGEDLAYALMVLAREGAANMGDLRYYADQKGEALATPLAAAQLGAALALYGDQTRADRLFARAARMIDAASGTEAPVWRADYGTQLRDTAGVLALAVEAGSSAVDTGALAQRIGAAGRAFSTQEASWSLLAAHALSRDASVAGLEVNGLPVSGPVLRTTASDLALAPVGLRNASTAPMEVTLTTFGVPEGATLASGYGYRIERAYYDLDGAPLSPDDVRIGTRLVAVLTVTPADETGARLMVNDPLPAGFEIDNPNLLNAGDVAALDWLDPAYAEHAEFRADRFLAAVDWQSDRPFTLAYIVRAISPGQFHHPAALVEDMYRPEYRATTASGRVTVGE